MMDERNIPVTCSFRSLYLVYELKKVAKSGSLEELKSSLFPVRIISELSNGRFFYETEEWIPVGERIVRGVDPILEAPQKGDVLHFRLLKQDFCVYKGEQKIQVRDLAEYVNYLKK